MVIRIGPERVISEEEFLEQQKKPDLVEKVSNYSSKKGIEVDGDFFVDGVVYRRIPTLVEEYERINQRYPELGIMKFLRLFNEYLRN
ncbi:hypothetical protein KY330_06130 [Candidatus Woesearchaeota archaeon]|nr:hypothetical protein [Candidatus Woesearchaeota archaeon]